MTAPVPAGDGIGGLLDRLEEARKAATAGPWRTGGSGVVAGLEYVAMGVRTDPDAALIVAAVNAVEPLIAAARERDRLRADLLAEADRLDAQLAATGVLLDRCIRPGDRLRAVAAAAGEA